MSISDNIVDEQRCAIHGQRINFYGSRHGTIGKGTFFSYYYASSTICALL